MSINDIDTIIEFIKGIQENPDKDAALSFWIKGIDIYVNEIAVVENRGEWYSVVINKTLDEENHQHKLE